MQLQEWAAYYQQQGSSEEDVQAWVEERLANPNPFPTQEYSAHEASLQNQAEAPAELDSLAVGSQDLEQDEEQFAGPQTPAVSSGGEQPGTQHHSASEKAVEPINGQLPQPSHTDAAAQGKKLSIFLEYQHAIITVCPYMLLQYALIYLAHWLGSSVCEGCCLIAQKSRLMITQMICYEGHKVPEI